jgi:predicted dithiol-disulfide oxidoreductase (DUF899 family)
MTEHRIVDTYSAFARGLAIVNAAYHLMDLGPAPR